jgi:hypothetical protein
MLDLPSADERRRLRVHADFKAAVYKERRDCWLFIESSTSQARIIYELSGKAVLAYGDMIFFSENGLAKIQRGMTRSGFRRIVSQMLPRRSKTVIKSVLRI